MLPAGHYLMSGAQRENRHSYHYANGSEILLGGMNDPGVFMSADFDIIYAAEATQMSEDAIEQLLTRLRHGRMDWHQLLMDCNPDMEWHWLNLRCKRKRTQRVKTYLQDNPKFWNQFTGGWTRQGKAYLRTLSGLTGHRRQRWLLGKWCQPEGARFPNVSRQINGFDFYSVFPYGIPEHWKRWLAADWGISDPYCCLWITVSPGGKFFIYKEDYQKGFEAHEQIVRIVTAAPTNEKYEGIWMDSSMWRSIDKPDGSENKMAPSLGALKTRGSAAKQYADEIAKPEYKGRFGLLYKGHLDKEERDYTTLSALFASGDLWISRDCVNTWNEIEGAVTWKDPRTGYTSELINPPGKKPKPCPDHSLKCCCYGLVNRTPVSSDPESTAIDLEAGRAEQLKRQVAARGVSKLPKWVK